MNSQFNRTAIYVALGLSIALVVGVIVGAKVVFTTADRSPVAMSQLPSNAANDPRCTQFIADLPQKFMGHKRATIAEPVPAGAAAWATLSDESVTLRCGVDLPLQYNVYSATEDIETVAWLKVRDMTPGSPLTTWYTTNRFPVVAVTTFDDQKPQGLNLGALSQEVQQPYADPLGELIAHHSTEASKRSCQALLDAVDDTMASEYHRMNSNVPADEAVWVADGREPIIIRCAVDSPPGYEAGVQLQQINEIPWFEDTTLGSGTTASTWFALGRDTNIAVHVPQDVAQAVLVELGKKISATTTVVAR